MMRIFGIGIYNKGFTLIELLVVVSIVGLLSVVIMANVNSTRTKARDTVRALNAKQVKSALQLYYTDNGSYPSSGCEGCIAWISTLAPTLQPYIKKIVTDEQAGMQQYVRGQLGGWGYGILMLLEKTGTSCKTGVEMNPEWWGAAPVCNF
jgi:prepilin-type N-terminal cleavage/methylation domain-containing protein